MSHDDQAILDKKKQIMLRARDVLVSHNYLQQAIDRLQDSVNSLEGASLISSTNITSFQIKFDDSSSASFDSQRGDKYIVFEKT